CIPCASGSYSDVEGSTTCTACPEGMTSRLTGSASILDCRCTSGKYMDPKSGACLACPGGTYNNESRLTFCATGCATCPIHSTSVQGSSSRSDCVCEAGFYDAEAAARSSTQGSNATIASSLAAGPDCRRCAEGSYSNGTGSTVCNEECAMCPGGSYSSMGGSTSCTTSGPDCRRCAEGSYSNGTGSTVCIPCASGSYSDVEGSTTCTACPEGMTSRLTGSASILDCRCTSGKYMDPKSGACLACPGGTYNNESRLTFCQHCPDDMESAPGSSSVDDCKCTMGFVSGLNGSTGCHGCPAGSYNDVVGATYCKSC
ncbi:hypothetical protein GUITHDRAFT_50744, partial [Guillardia theta CCMP2712]